MSTTLSVNVLKHDSLSSAYEHCKSHMGLISCMLEWTSVTSCVDIKCFHCVHTEMSDLITFSAIQLKHLYFIEKVAIQALAGTCSCSVMKSGPANLQTKVEQLLCVRAQVSVPLISEGPCT